MISRHERRIAIVDVETTGLSPWRHDRIIEIAVVIISPDGRIQHEYETLINPRRDLGPTRIHGITASDIAGAPAFEDIADDVMELLAGTHALAGHNVAFDRNFLVKEYERTGVVFPTTSLLCTCQLFGRASLAACCEDLGIELTGAAHRALIDARATAQIVASLLADDDSILERHLIDGSLWPQPKPRRTACYTRDHSKLVSQQPPKFLQRMAEKLRHDIEGATADSIAYTALIDRVLEDRVIDATEEHLLIDAAVHWNLSAPQVAEAHRSFLHALAVAALADGVVTDAERRDLHAVAKLLGQDVAALDTILSVASQQLASVNPRIPAAVGGEDLMGKRVCFTGELVAKIAGQPIARDVAQSMAERAGLIISAGVNKKLDLLVVADPNTQSGKAVKAREYGCRIVAENVFWKMIGVEVD